MAKKKGQTCILFEKQPPETNYQPGTYSWVSDSTADDYIKKGYGKEFDPKEIREKRKAEEESAIKTKKRHKRAVKLPKKK